MRDGFVRRSLKRLALAWFIGSSSVDRGIARLLGRRPFLLGGDCRRCGACCDAPAIHVGWVTWHFPTLRSAFLAWQRHVNGFVQVELDRASRTFVFRCTHFDTSTRRCDSYDSRPGMCRDYPRVLLYQAKPELLPACGYRPIARDSKRLLRVLDAEPLTDEQRARLRKNLFLE
jgi:Fe-S-cluster containining protein